MTMMETLDQFSPQSVKHTYEEEVCQELCLRLAESLSDLGACEFTREIECDGVKWLVTVKQR